MQRFRKAFLAAACAAALAILGDATLVTAQNSDDPLRRLTEIHQKLMDPGQVFSRSATMAELDKLEKKVQVNDLRAQGELHFLRGFVLYKAGLPEESLPPSREALRIDTAAPFLSENERALLINRIAMQAEEVGEWAVAIDAYRKLIPLVDADPAIPVSARLAKRAGLAFCLHETGNYAEAAAVNRDILADGERLLGAENKELLVVLTNLAQNTYSLSDNTSARSFLERALSLATKHQNPKYLDNSLFQLGVLSFEEGRPAEAEKFMKDRLALAKKSGDSTRVKDAQRDLDVLYEKMGRR